MTTAFEIRQARLRNQRLAGAPCAGPEAVVAWMGAVQAQEYREAQWGLALRARRITRADIQRACDDGRILRTHVLRPTWHFVTPADIRWMLALTGPYIGKRMASYNRVLELDASVFRKTRTVITRALRAGGALTRQELKAALERAGINTTGVQRLSHIVIQAELDGLICSGPRRGAHATYALLDERAPLAPAWSREEALAELTRRYFASHGPAQLYDYAWWSGLPVGEARRGLAMVESELRQIDCDGGTYWCGTPVRASPSGARTYLLPIYDEYLIAYKDRRAAYDRTRWTGPVPGDTFSAPLVADGLVLGTWRRRLSATTVHVTLACRARLTRAEQAAVADAAGDYARFLGVGLELTS